MITHHRGPRQNLGLLGQIVVRAHRREEAPVRLLKVRLMICEHLKSMVSAIYAAVDIGREGDYQVSTAAKKT